MGLFDSVKKIVVGDIAHGSADTGVPIGMGAFARSTAPTAVSNSTRVRLWADQNGRLQTNTARVEVVQLINATPATNADVSLSVPTAWNAWFRAVGFYIYNNTGLDVRIRLAVHGSSVAGYVFEKIMTTGTFLVVAPGGGGEGASASYASVPALAFNVFGQLQVRYTLTGTPTGALRIDAGGMS